MQWQISEGDISFGVVKTVNADLPDLHGFDSASCMLTMQEESGRCLSLQLLHGTVGWLLCLCPGELKFKLTSGGFLCPQCLNTVTKPSLS